MHKHINLSFINTTLAGMEEGRRRKNGYNWVTHRDHPSNQRENLVGSGLGFTCLFLEDNLIINCPVKYSFQDLYTESYACEMLV